MKPLESFSYMDSIIVMWCFHTKFALLWYSSPVILSIKHFTCENEGNHLQGGELYNSTWRINPITSRGDYCVTSPYNIYYIIQQMSDKNIQTHQEKVAILI